MVCHVRLGARRGIELAEPASPLADATLQATGSIYAVDFVTRQKQLQKRADVALLDRQTPVHVKFAECQFGIDDQTKNSSPIMHANFDMQIARAERFAAPIGNNDR